MTFTVETLDASAMTVPVLRPLARRVLLLGAAGLLVACSASAAPAPGPGALTVVELFQSQGCSSCPPANANVNAIAGRPDILALSFGVTYWDDLGWKDTFASKQFTDRQWDYAHGLGNSNVATPQVVLNGRREVVGNDRGKLDRALTTAGPSPAPVTFTSGRVEIAAGRAPAKPADVWLVRYDPRVQQVPISRGENLGKTLPHRNIVRQLTRLGRWNGAAQSYTLTPAADPALRTAVLVQTTGGPILAAGKP